MNNLLSYCGLVDAKISAFEKDLPVKGALLKTNDFIAVFELQLRFLFIFAIVPNPSTNLLHSLLRSSL